MRWDGEYEAINRLILGFPSNLGNTLIKLGLSSEQAAEIEQSLLELFYEPFLLSAMPIQDAIDLPRFPAETTVGFVRSSLQKQPKTVGAPVEIAAITKHEGFRWIQRKHFFQAALNAQPTAAT